jgi:hypothetical protein
MKFTFLQLKDEFKDDIACDMGLFGGHDGFEYWMETNIHPTCTGKVFSDCRRVA